jgi:signal peptidase I
MVKRMGKKFVAQEYTAATQGKGLRESTAAGRFFTNAMIGLSITAVLLSVVIVAFTFAFSLSPVKGKSMMKTLNATGENTDSVLVSKFAHPKRGDVIITKLYGKDTADPTAVRFTERDENGNFEYIIKRLIALPGDKITIRKINTTSDYEYYIYLNGEKLDESYLDKDVAPHNSTNFVDLYNAIINEIFSVNWKLRNCVSNDVLTVPEGYWFFMGDNRGSSWDCSNLGPQKMEYYVGLSVDTLKDNETVPRYLWRKFCYYALFGWIADL